MGRKSRVGVCKQPLRSMKFIVDRSQEAAAAEFQRREQVAAELKLISDQDLRKAYNKYYKVEKAMKQALVELRAARQKLKQANAALHESEKKARGLATKLLVHECASTGRLKGKQAEVDAVTDQLKKVSALSAAARLAKMGGLDVHRASTSSTYFAGDAANKPTAKKRWADK
eukprot:4924411-Pleurochrysis_carterae.AAC.2